MEETTPTVLNRASFAFVLMLLAVVLMGAFSVVTATADTGDKMVAHRDDGSSGPGSGDEDDDHSGPGGGDDDDGDTATGTTRGTGPSNTATNDTATGTRTGNSGPGNGDTATGTTRGTGPSNTATNDTATGTRTRGGDDDSNTRTRTGRHS